MNSSLIVGLGNPGEKYQNTRHNIGFKVLDAFFKKFDESTKNAFRLNKKINGKIAIISKQEKIHLLKPFSFMNLSGAPVAATMNYFDINIKKIIVIHDDIDLPFGQIRLSKNSGSGGHNGIKSIIEHLGTKDFLRLRIGVSTEISRRNIPTEKFVLGNFSAEENIVLTKIIISACDCLEHYLENGPEKAMNKFNQKGSA